MADLNAPQLACSEELRGMLYSMPHYEALRGYATEVVYTDIIKIGQWIRLQRHALQEDMTRILENGATDLTGLVRNLLCASVLSDAYALWLDETYQLRHAGS